MFALVALCSFLIRTIRSTRGMLDDKRWGCCFVILCGYCYFAVVALLSLVLLSLVLSGVAYLGVAITALVLVGQFWDAIECGPMKIYLLAVGSWNVVVVLICIIFLLAFYLPNFTLRTGASSWVVYKSSMDIRADDDDHFVQVELDRGTTPRNQSPAKEDKPHFGMYDEELIKKEEILRKRLWIACFIESILSLIQLAAGM
eukprot:TRINITY_DN1419_c0_g1_i4.p1 TRINITY_DN1419_c0_g1~~TRINITY_DN1419_c0_g1_i4.p1  ORF type:complete len:201 (-),score=11.53 TRINITY_DN1419_c0_g1_i4:347-949(-)